jgi:hypothetical protein
MKLSELVVRWKTKGMTHPEALSKAKDKVRKFGERWTKNKQAIFDTSWSEVTESKPSKQPRSSIKPTTDGKISNIDETKTQGGTYPQRIKFFNTILAPCKFPKSDWSKFGLHVRATNTTEPSKEQALALKLLKQHGFTYAHNIKPKVFQEARETRTVAWYNDRYNNSISTVAQKSNNGKDDFFILNLSYHMTLAEKEALQGMEWLEEKKKAAQEKIANGELKQQKRKEDYQLSFHDYLKNAKGTQTIRVGVKEFGPEELKEQWINKVEEAIKDGRQVPQAVKSEYNVMTKAVGSVYKLPVLNGKDKTVTLDEEKLNKIIRNLKKKGVVVVKSDDKTAFTLSTEQLISSVPCGPALRSALKLKKLWAMKGRL